jgi:DNA-binding transcriptional regulator YiaG
MTLTADSGLHQFGGMSKLPTMTPEELRAIRAEMGDTQVEAAARYGVATATYKRWEQGVNEIPGPVVILGGLLLQIHRAASGPGKD